MTYENMENSLDRGGPITLYEFAIGTDEKPFRYTDSDKREFHEGVPCEKIPRRRGKIENSGSLTKVKFEITVPKNLEIVRLYAAYPPSDVVYVRVLEGHYDDRDRQFLTVAAGRLLNVKIEQGRAILLCEPATTSIRRPGLRRNWQRGCPLQLYGPACRAVRVDEECEVRSFDQNTIFVSAPAGGFLPGIDAYANGILQWVNQDTARREVRSLLDGVAEDDGFRLRVAGPVFHVPETVFVTKGCSHTEEACLLWHNNILNYGGQRWIPYKNPVGNLSVYF